MPVFRSLLALLLCSVVAQAADLKLLSGKTLSGEVVSVSDKDGIILRTKDGMNVATPLANVLQLELAPLPAPKLTPCTRVELTDGSVVFCQPDDGFRIFNKNQVELKLISGTKLVTPLNTLYIVRKDEQDPKVREHKDWPVCIARSKKLPARDVRAVRSGDTLNGFRGSFLETGDGSVLKFIRESHEDEDAKKPRLVDLKDKDLVGIIFTKPANSNAVPSICKLDDLDQNRLTIAKLEMKEGGPLVVTTVTGAKAEYPLKQVGRLDFSKGKVEYVSNLPRDGVDIDVKVEKKPPDSDLRTFQICYNKNFDDQKLAVRVLKPGQPAPIPEPYDYGLYLPATSQLLYKLGGEYDEFSAVLGMDYASKTPSNVRLTIEGDGTVLLSAEITPTAVLIKGRDPKDAKPSERISLNIKDVKELRIKVEPSGNAVLGTLLGGHVDLADAKISKASK